MHLGAVRSSHEHELVRTLRADGRFGALARVSPPILSELLVLLANFQPRRALVPIDTGVGMREASRSGPKGARWTGCWRLPLET